MQRAKKAIIVSAVVGLSACAGATVSSPDDVTGVEWTLVEVNGVAVDTAGLMRKPTLLLDAEGRASGSTSCNQFTGGYTIEGDELRFGAVAMTKMACMEGMTVETAYSNVFEATRTWRVVDGRLELLDGNAVLARFTR